ncbi:MAG: molybdopterin-guanine dinucleotide biosynthesis protein B [Gammaproteobacteria bacterium]|nr:MAG: molybdopterin-guanine dinucleotide biosynthesis protein B [Gammaproteobacteria bacterium]
MQTISFDKPVIGFSAYSGSGKTTLLEKLIPILSARKLRVAVIKHAHHSFDIDHPEKDSYKIRKAGAQQILISSQKRWAMIHEHADENSELSLQEALQHISVRNIDLVIVEGFKSAPIAKIEIHRPTLKKPLISASDKYVIAIATDDPSQVESKLPLLDLNNIDMIANYVEQFLTKTKA